MTKTFDEVLRAAFAAGLSFSWSCDGPETGEEAFAEWRATLADPEENKP